MQRVNVSDNWQQGKNKHGNDKYYIQNDEWTICKVKINNLTSYELWHKRKNYGYGFASADAAKAHYEKVKNDD